jgi:hypothetical protein
VLLLLLSGTSAKIYSFQCCITVFLQTAMFIYVTWRALRSLVPGWGYAYAIPFWLCEFAGFIMSNAFVAGLWKQIERPPLRLEEMLPLKERPHVDIMIVTYSGEQTLPYVVESWLDCWLV